ncbi:hypothetical protein J3E72DRAFT_418495 [Bipolaris maydis]|uniref:uncharacterized protein n=1 Tax=Cochliobolus heterostrophus TaxID=5016 RepID=UPI0024D2A3F6|nr:hypothetical protein J3E73DRAFT_411139 [Bipolaris maydis]KAJ5059709.1 hypothetical protein J3E74DRAFT_454305 [Bipolaris maydis]KAJ6197323.1 hypothetical protein J3E72DRAFT_418495 [Bipolaris maydis]KAJ6209703.1 hypothetical protein PSV09DRAFT_2421289 [Bipolaris maydis]KAJ6271321.1 hypothetical protein PSV08DRAFT_389451 [Bipolaris maydis]
MTEPSPNPAPEHDMDAPILNGEAQMQQQLADVEMADSTSDQPPQAEPSPPSQAPPLQQPTTTTQTQPPTPSQTTTTTPSAPAPSAPAAHPATAPASSRNSPHPTAQAPTQPIPHGSPTRVYLNQHVTPYLLEAMKHLATQEPEKPLKWLSEFLAKKSAEVEGA